MTDNELLYAMSDMFDNKLKPIKEDISLVKEDVNHVKEDISLVKEDVNHVKEDINLVKKDVDLVKKQVNLLKEEVDRIKLQNENDILPRLQNIESCYTSTYNRYKDGVEQLDAMQADIDIMKKVVAEHSEKLQKIC